MILRSTYCLVLFLSGFVLQAKASEQLQKALDEGDYKTAIHAYQQQLEQSPLEEKGWLLKKLAIIKFKDQEQEKAFQIFLEALEIAPDNSPACSLTPDEEALYQKALSVYLDHNNGSPQIISEKIYRIYEPVLMQQPHLHLLAYLVASACANLGKYEEFFNLFYDSYCFYPNHYLAYKTKAILHIKLLERARTATERETQRWAIFQDLSKAIEKQPTDDSLYKMLIVFSPEEKKNYLLCDSLNKIIDGNMIIPRADMSFYVQKAVDAKEYALAQRFIDKAREWYRYSRVIDSAQQYLDAHK
jgi:hypothetical protein